LNDWRDKKTVGTKRPGKKHPAGKKVPFLISGKISFNAGNMISEKISFNTMGCQTTVTITPAPWKIREYIPVQKTECS
jgi:hypothetical protein